MKIVHVWLQRGLKFEVFTRLCSKNDSDILQQWCMVTDGLESPDTFTVIPASNDCVQTSSKACHCIAFVQVFTPLIVVTTQKL